MVLGRLGDSLSLEDAKLLGESIHLPFSGKVAKSRFLKGAMTERMSSWDQHDLSKRGIPSNRLVRLYEEWGKGGYGIILTGNVMIHPEQLEAPGNPVLYAPHETPERLEQFRKLAAGAKAQGSIVIMQISHAGRQVASFVNPNPVSAGDVKLDDRMGMSFGKPTPLTKDGIKEVVDWFAYAAETAHRTGYDGVQLHGAHGYLLAQFLSQTTNNRSDEYGGSIHNRARIIREITAAIRSKVRDPSFVIGIKINSTEFQEKGFQPEEAAELCKELEAIEMDFVELSGGTYERLAFSNDDSKPRGSTKKREAFFTEFAEKITPSLTKTVPYVTGGFRTAAGMAEAIRSGSCAGVGIARPACSDPYLPAEIIAGKAAGSTEVKLPANDFAILSMAAGAQMEALGRDEPVFDLSDPKVVRRFNEAAQAYRKDTMESMKKGVVRAGWPVLGANY
ncbi:NADH:flavin oxidoreductase/NADH oxidase [Ceratobasidium sp. AG-Ba]|nr:NADH:flavin oxidoreductase/NADH oxidase [Ceratobasidium sp. AG-Ba]